MSQVTNLIKRYMMSHYNMTVLDCLPKKVQGLVLDEGLLLIITERMKSTRLISTTEFESLCKHVKFSKIP